MNTSMARAYDLTNETGEPASCTCFIAGDNCVNSLADGVCASVLGGDGIVAHRSQGLYTRHLSLSHVLDEAKGVDINTQQTRSPTLLATVPSVATLLALSTDVAGLVSWATVSGGNSVTITYAQAGRTALGIPALTPANAWPAGCFVFVSSVIAASFTVEAVNPGAPATLSFTYHVIGIDAASTI